MITIDDDQKILNLNHMAIYLMLTAEEIDLYQKKLKDLNTYRSLTHGIFRFEIVEKGDTPYEKLPKEMTRAITNSNVLIRLINSIHGAYCYGLDKIDLSLEAEGLRAELGAFVKQVCKKNVQQMDILSERSTSTSLQAIREYKDINIVQDIFERALAGETIRRADCPSKQMIRVSPTTDLPESRSLMQEAFTNPTSEKIERERCEREAPDTKPSISVTITNVPTGKTYKNGKPKRATYGIQIIVDGDVVPVPIARIDEQMLYTSVLKATKDGKRLRRKDFTYDDKYSRDPQAWKDMQSWLKKIYKFVCVSTDFDEWFHAVNAAGPAARINDAKSKFNKVLWQALYPRYKDAYYYCCIATENPRTDNTRYKIRLNKNSISFDETIRLNPL